ncbi:MAG: phage holin family protein, partial [Anaerovoracaceae bacterium]|nr:phage holin family protein [Anaerovoracaceae bacterium]
IDGAIRKIGMIISLALLVLVDAVIKVNLIGFVPEAVRGQLGVEAIGLAEFFSLLYIAYEIISILKNMALCGLPVKGIWVKVKGFLGKYTTELPDDE